jgi:ethanolaminephosphotransferase
MNYFQSGYTILDVIHIPFWNWLTNLLPMWLAPNVITLVGLLGVILSFLINSWYLMDYQGEISVDI